MTNLELYGVVGRASSWRSEDGRFYGRTSGGELPVGHRERML